MVENRLDTLRRYVSIRHVDKVKYYRQMGNPRYEHGILLYQSHAKAITAKPIPTNPTCWKRQREVSVDSQSEINSVPKVFFAHGKCMPGAGPLPLYPESGIESAARSEDLTS